MRICIFCLTILIGSLAFPLFDSTYISESENNQLSMNKMHGVQINSSGTDSSFFSSLYQPILIDGGGFPKLLGQSHILAADIQLSSNQISVIYKNNQYDLLLFESNLFNFPVNSSHFSGWVINDPYSIVTLSYGQYTDDFNLYISTSEGRNIFIEGWNQELHELFELTADHDELIIYDNEDIMDASNIEFQPSTPNFINQRYLTYASNGNQVVLPDTSKLLRIKMILDSSSSSSWSKIKTALTFANGIFEGAAVTKLFVEQREDFTNSEVLQLDSNADCDGNTFRLIDDLPNNPKADDSSWNAWGKGERFDVIIYYTEDSHFVFKSPIMGCAKRPDKGIPAINKALNAYIDSDSCFSNKCWAIILSHEIGHTLTLEHNDGDCNWYSKTVMCTPYSFISSTLTWSANSIIYLTNVDLNNAAGLAWLRHSREITQGNLLVDSQSISLSYFNIDVLNPMIFSCDVLFRVTYNLQQQPNLMPNSVAEFFVGVRSSYIRGLPGEWDMWQGYDRPINGHFIPPGGYLWVSGWMKARDLVNVDPSILITYGCQISKHKSDQQLHIFQPKNVNDPQYSLVHSWSFWPVYNFGSTYQPPYAHYSNFMAAEINIFVLN